MSAKGFPFLNRDFGMEFEHAFKRDFCYNKMTARIFEELGGAMCISF